MARGVGAALDAALNGAAAPGAETLVDVAGCAIGYPQEASVSYSDTIAPLLADNCVTCHRDGGIGPWAMTDYNMVRGFSPMIREVLRTRRMPPWHADPMHGDFANDRSLEPAEVRALVGWIDAGSPRGDGPDPLAELEREWPVWELGEPDLVIEIPAQDVPASGVVEYQYPFAVNPLDHDVWVRATEILPGDRQALHHVITRFFVPKSDSEGGVFGRRGHGLGGYVPGSVARQFPAGHGHAVAGRGAVRFPDALHALRQAHDGHLEARDLLPRRAAETPACGDGAAEQQDTDSAAREGAYGVAVAGARARRTRLQPPPALALPGRRRANSPGSRRPAAEGKA